MNKLKAIYLVAFLTIGILAINSCSKNDDCTKQTWYQDSDGDGFGNPNNSLQSCTQPNGYVSDNTDFDDTNASLNPNASEVADNDIDENGDGVFDYNLYIDADGDGFGVLPSVLIHSQTTITTDADLPIGYTFYNNYYRLDCDDNNPDIHPYAYENQTDGIDNDCDGFIDESSVCGNGVIEDGEECDDGNAASGDGCNDKCYSE